MNYYPNCAYLSNAYHSRLRTYSIRIVTPPFDEHISLDDARLHLRLDSYGSPPEHADDDLIAVFITAAREWCEFYSGRSLASQVIELALPQFPHAWYRSCDADEIRLPMGPIAGVESVIYTDQDGVDQTLDSSLYVVDVSQDIGYVFPLMDPYWPMTQARRPNAVRIRYHTGYTLEEESPNDMPLPSRYRSAMLLVLGHLYENRENTTELQLETLPLAAASLLNGSRLRLGFA